MHASQRQRAWERKIQPESQRQSQKKSLRDPERATEIGSLWLTLAYKALAWLKALARLIAAPLCYSTLSWFELHRSPDDSLPYSNDVPCPKRKAWKGDTHCLMRSRKVVVMLYLVRLWWETNTNNAKLQMLFSILNNTLNCLVTKVQVQVQDLNCQNYNQCLKCLGLSLLFWLYGLSHWEIL